ncbi:phage major capsid protein [Vibrio sp. D420a]|uniref:phage major capsid protein n=1 Tax=Vibrio sp. D420a TaxID=2836895 RepID=UPI0025548AAD|nr:phage major capsid protein [Vibrio sp. D420a]MDK9763961.1 phage major capsid protein [Vibrio sp. D420a]
MNLQNYLKKSLMYDPVYSAPELSDQITEQAFNTSSLLAEMGQEIADNPSYRNVFVRHPSISRVIEGDDIPSSTVQTYHTTESDFTKIASKIEFTNEVLTQSKFDIEENTSMLVGNVAANEIATLVVENLQTRQTQTPITDPNQMGYGEDILKVKTGTAPGVGWGDVGQTYELLAEAVKNIADVYDGNSKLFLNKNNFTTFVASVTDQFEQVWLIQGGQLFGRYDVVICDQLDDNTMYFGDMQAAFDVVSLQGNQTVDPVTVPNLLKITQSNKYATVAKDASALVALVQEV